MDPEMWHLTEREMFHGPIPSREVSEPSAHSAPLKIYNKDSQKIVEIMTESINPDTVSSTTAKEPNKYVEVQLSPDSPSVFVKVDELSKLLKMGKQRLLLDTKEELGELIAEHNAQAERLLGQSTLTATTGTPRAATPATPSSDAESPREPSLATSIGTSPTTPKTPATPSSDAESPREPSPTTTSTTPKRSLLETRTDIRKSSVAGLGNFRQIGVMDQNATGQIRGFELCGFHAFKNAALAFALDTGSTDLSPESFTSEEFFNEWRRFASGFTAAGDIGIAGIRQAYQALLDANPASLTPSLGKLQAALKANPESISFFNPIHIGDELPSTEIATEENFTSGVEYTNLSSLSHLVDINSKPGPLTHSFLLGSTGHWITLTLHKNAAGEKTWYGFDSYGNQTSLFKKQKEILERVLADPTAHLERGYSDAMNAEHLARKAALFTEQGDLRSDEDLAKAQDLIRDKEEYLKKIKNGFEFMEKAGWLTSTNTTIKQYVKDLKTLANFFEKRSLQDAVGAPAIKPIIDRYKTQEKEAIINAIAEAYENVPNETLKSDLQEIFKVSFKRADRLLRDTIRDEQRAADKHKTKEELIADLKKALNRLNNNEEILSYLIPALQLQNSIALKDLTREQLVSRLTDASLAIPTNEISTIAGKLRALPSS